MLGSNERVERRILQLKSRASLRSKEVHGVTRAGEIKGDLFS